MTRDQPTGSPGVSRARARARRAVVTLAALLAAGELAGCAGITNPYQTNGTATSTTSTSQAPPRFGSIVPCCQPLRDHPHNRTVVPAYVLVAQGPTM